LVVLSLPAFTQENIDTTKNEIKLNEIVVLATRWNQQSQDIPSKIITISPKNIALQNPQTAADMLSNTGKVFVQKSQLGGGSQ